jgi:glucosyl-dolichyl phosphate glucuronosyltransferase
MQPFVSVVIPTLDRLDRLPSSVEAATRQDYPKDRYEVIIVDNGPTDGEESFKRQFAGLSEVDVKYVWEPRLGLHWARNTGAEAARGEILAYTDDDTEVDPGWVAALAACYQDPEIGAAGGPIRLRWTNPPPTWAPSLGLYGELDYGDEPVMLASPRTIHGANFSVRRAALYETGGFNADLIGPRMVSDGETGLCHKLYRSGWKLAYTPHAAVHHVQDGAAVTLASMKGRFRNHGRFAACLNYKEQPTGSAGLMAQAARALARAALSKSKSLARRPTRGQGYYAQEMLVSQNLAMTTYFLRLVWSADFRRMATREDWLAAPATVELANSRQEAI